MRKAIFTTLAAGAIILAGCTKTEVTEVSDSRAISFSNHVTNAVKSIDQLKDLTTFYVYGAHANGQVFNGDAVSYSNGECTYNPTRYWDNTKSDYKFAAYTDNNKTVSNPENNVEFTYSNGHLTITDYTVNNTPTDESDLLYAVGYDGTDYVFDGTNHYEVQLEFKHILSKVTFNFSKAADLNGVEIDVSDITINAFNQGTFTGNTPTSLGSQYALSCWVPSGQKSDIAFDNFSLTGSATDETSKNIQTRVFLPQDLETPTAYNIVFTIQYSNTINDDGTINNTQKNQIKDFTCTIAGTEDGKWNPGYSYTYTAEINSTNLEGLYPIEFTVSYDAWEEKNVDDIISDGEKGQ